MNKLTKIPTRIVSVAGLAGVIAALASCGGTGPLGEDVGTSASALATLTPVTTFGTNPGSLLMYTYVPQGMPAKAPLVLALHGCTQSASVYEEVGWNALADKYKFYLVYPQQQSQNNSEGCFNWAGEYGNPADITRDQGEAASVKEMVDYMKTTYSIDDARVFATGFSAGAAYAVALLALYPDVFAGGSSFAGIPFKCATTLTAAFTCQDSATSMTPSQWGDLVRGGDTGYSGPFPRISIWQGSADTTVNTANLDELVEQWTNATGASTTPSTSTTVDGYPHDEYKDSKGVVQVESYSITGMPHAVAIDPNHGCGTADTYSIDKGICAVDLVAKFLGLEGPQAIVPTSSDAGTTAKVDAGTGGNPGTGPTGGTGGKGNGVTPGSPNSGATGAADAGDGLAGPATLPGCSVARTSRPLTEQGLLALGIAIPLFARRRSRASRKEKLS